MIVFLICWAASNGWYCFGIEEFYSYKEKKNSTKKTKQGNKIQKHNLVSM